MTKKIEAGAEVDSWCTKCKMDLNHRIIAMEGDKIKRVECLTCRGHHNYRRPKSADPPKKKKATRKKKASSKKVVVPDFKKLWEEAIVGRSPEDFTTYHIAEVFEVGQLIRHKKFGDGVVSELIEGGKVQVIFEPGPKVMVHGRG